jgi:hypothetical protein
MAICTRCGAIIHEEDMVKHICKSENIPAKGQEIINGVKTAVIK